MRTRLRQGLSAALKSRDPVSVAALRSALAAIENAESTGIVGATASSSSANSRFVAGSAVGLGAGEVERRTLAEREVWAIVQGEVDERTDTAAEYDRLFQRERADRMRAEADVLRAYLAATDAT